MTNTKNTKRALLSSVVALFLCFTMLLGTTFAWFTDSVTSANNIIKSGNLDIELEYWNGKEWKDVNGASDILTNTRWEPGVTEVAYLRIKNNGSLAFKYQLSVNIAKETAGKNIAGDDFLLSDYIYFDIVDGQKPEFTDRDAAMVYATETTKISEGYTKDGLLEEGSDYVNLAMVVYMPTNVGNVANHDGENIPQIDLGINVLATQATVEDDSFNNQYDANAWTEVAETPTPDANGVVDIYSAQQLAGVMQNFTGVKVINIKEDIDLNGRIWVPAFVTAPGLVINGNGHIISNMTTSGASNVGFIGAAYQDITIKDLTFKNAKVEATGSFVGIVIGNGWGGNAITLDNVDVIDSEASTSIRTKAIRIGALIGYSPYTRGDLTIKNCDVTGSTIVGYHNVGAMVGTMMFYGPEQGTITIENSTAKNNTLVHSGNNVGAFAFGASTSGYTEYIPASGFTAENNTVICRVYTDAQLAEAIKSPAFDLITVASGEYGVIDVRVNRTLTIAAQDGADVKIAGINGQSNNNASDITIKGITIDNSLATAGWYTGTAQNIKPCVGVWGGDYTFEDCTFFVTGESGAETGVMSWWTTEHGTMTFKGCTFNGGNGSARGMQIYGNYDLNVEDCTFTTAKDYAIKYVGAEDCKATLTGNNVYNTKNFVQAGSGTYPGKNYTIEFKNNTLADGINNFYVDNYENQTIIVDGTHLALATNTDMLKDALAADKDVVLSDNILVSSADTGSNGYGKTGATVKNGQIFDGNGKNFGVNAWATWDSAINTTGGTIKNVVINSGMRGIFMNGATDNVYIDNVIFDGTVYTFNSDAGSKNYGVYISNSTLNGWTSHSDVHKEVVYTNCNFGEGSGYAYCRPYGPTTFKNCAFEAGFVVEALGQVTFENCTIGGVALTAGNLATLVTSGTIANATVK